MLHVYTSMQAIEEAAVQRGIGTKLAITRQTLGLGYVDAIRCNQEGA